MSNTVNNYTETDLGNISLNPRGEYDNSAAYEYLDTVSYQGGSYFCLAELETTITGIAPDAGRNSKHWQMIAAPGDMTPEYTAAYNDVIKKAVQVETSRAAVELAQQEIEAAQTDVQQLHSDTVQAAQEAENSKNSAANSAQSAEQSRKMASESEQNIKGQITGFDSRVSEAVEQSKAEIDTTKQQAIDTITNQQNTSVNTVKAEGEKIITRVGNDAKTVADDRATVEEATQTVLNNAREVAQNTQTVAGNMENAAASAESAKTSADNAAQSAKSVEDASKQIEQNKKDVTSLKEDLTSKADKTSLAQTDRKLDALWKLNQGITYQFEADSESAYQKTIPTGAKMASVKQIDGKTIVWNQLLKLSLTSQTRDGCTIEVDENKHIKISGIPSNSLYLEIGRISFIKDHMYFINVNGKYTDEDKKSQVYIAKIELYKIQKTFFLCNETKDTQIQIAVYTADTSVDYDITVTVFDLTKMFGTGNEPSTPEEFEAMFPADYYPYNAGELMSASVNEVIYLDTKNQETSYPIPQAILNLSGYGVSAGNICNEVDWENKKYIQRVAEVDLGSLNYNSRKYENYKYFATSDLANMIAPDTINTLCNRYTHATINSVTQQKDMEIVVDTKGWLLLRNDSMNQDAALLKDSLSGVVLYYELVKPIVTDLTNIISEGFLEAIEVETGGSLTFQNSNGDDYRIPVPNSEEYVISLAEVAK